MPDAARQSGPCEPAEPPPSWLKRKTSQSPSGPKKVAKTSGSKPRIEKSPPVKAVIPRTSKLQDGKPPGQKSAIAKNPPKVPVHKSAPMPPAQKAAGAGATAPGRPADQAKLATCISIPDQADEVRATSSTGVVRSKSWRDFSDTDPLYAIKGELGEKKVFSPSGVLDEECLQQYLRRLMQPGVMSKNKDWIEVWAIMNIPIESQAEVVQAILEIGLESEVADTIPDALAELIKGHRVKIKAVEEAIQTLFECGSDQQGCLSRFLLLIFPKSPTSEWGWSRVGWNWQQWWTTADRVLATLDNNSAFVLLCNLLRGIETESGAYLPHQQIWDEKRLGTVRTALCKYGGLQEDELSAAVDVCLA